MSAPNLTLRKVPIQNGADLLKEGRVEIGETIEKIGVGDALADADVVRRCADCCLILDDVTCQFDGSILNGRNAHVAHVFFNPFLLELFVYPPEGEGQKPEDAVEEIQKEHRENQQQIQER